MVLGTVDYGLFGVIGGLTMFIEFINGLLGTAMARFYAVSIGKAKRGNDEGLKECNKWFSIAVIVHTLVPLSLMMIGYPIGIWAIRNWLVIPPDRIEACIWVFRCACVGCLVSMVNVPYKAMYVAKQYIAELTIYSFASTTVRILGLYYMVSHPGVWLTKYAVFTMLILVVPQVIICLRARIVFPECRFVLSLCRQVDEFKNLFAFAWWEMFGCLGSLLRSQGISILVNKYFGPTANASMSIAHTVNSQTNALSAALVGAFTPAITTAYGAGDMTGMRALAYRACKFGLVLSLLFVIPLSLELEYVIGVWLKNPPEYVCGLCWCMMAMLLINKSTVGHMVAVSASGRIALYQLILGGSLLLTLPLAWIFVATGLKLYSVGWAMILTMIACSTGRLWFARRIVGMSIRFWLRDVIVPIAIAVLISGGLGYWVRYACEASLRRLILTSLVTLSSFLIMTWGIILNSGEKRFVLERVKRRALRDA